MLQAQKIIRDKTVALDAVIKGRDGAKPERADVQGSLKMSDEEAELVKEASKAIQIIEAEGTAVAFAEVFKQVRTDMQSVTDRLRKTDVAVVTQTIENDIIATLEEMIEALKKARQENKQENKPKPPQQGQSQQQDQKLIDQIAELKMIRSMQIRVNNRTEVYGKQYEDKGEQLPSPEQAKDPEVRDRYEMIQRELKDLSNRQEKIRKVTDDIAKGRNKAQ